MGAICKECGCEDLRFDENIGYYCNNCSGINILYFKEFENEDFTILQLKIKYKEQMKK